MIARFAAGKGEVVVIASVQGLATEAARVREALDAEAPTVVALGASAESVAGLLRYQPDPEADPFDELPDHDYIYSVRLREFGDVELPPPDLVAALAWAREREATFFGVDLSEEAYGDLFTKEVSAFGFLRYGRIQRKLAKKPPRADTARAFALAWDARIRRVKGIARVEAARERAMADAAAQLAREGAKVALVVDVAREAGITAHLERARE